MYMCGMCVHECLGVGWVSVYVNVCERFYVWDVCVSVCSVCVW